MDWPVAHSGMLLATFAIAELLENVDWLNRARRIIQRNNVERGKRDKEAA